MLRIRLKFRHEALWLIAAAVISTLEIYAALGRERGGITATRDAGLIGLSAVVHQAQTVGVISASGNGAILVVGNPSTELDGEVEVVLRATRIPQTGVIGDVPLEGCGPPCLLPRRPQIQQWTARKPASTTAANATAPTTDSNRVYFLPTRVNGDGGDNGHTAIPCVLQRETARVRIFVDQRLPPDSQFSALVDAVAEAAESDLGDAVERLAGSVYDVDHDGHLAIVISPAVAQVGGGRTPVDGLTRPTDFLPGLERPLSNGSDVIFLSSALVPGNQLRAVLAHEWCHAAAFSRRSQISAEGLRRAQDDWLNEATAHVVEVRASGSDSNVAHRIQHFLAHPSQSPLVVRDYCQPAFWRHDGCRGAGYLFIESCLTASDDRCLKSLADHDRSGLAGLEDTFGQSFEQLFFQWTTQLGQYLASSGSAALPGVTCHQSSPQPVLAHHTWQLSGEDEQTMTVRLRATCVDFVRVETRDNTTWRLSWSTTGINAPSLQTCLIPVVSKSSPTGR